MHGCDPHFCRCCPGELAPTIAEELQRCAEVRGENVRLDSTRGALLASLDEWKEPKEPSTWASVLGRTLRWSAWSSYTFRNTSHFNLKEGRAPKNKVHKMALSPKIFGCVQLCLNDSRVICGAVSKGGSSSFKLNGLLRSMLPHLIFANISLALIWGRQMQILQIIQAVFGLYGLPCLFLVGCEDWE